MKITIKEVTKLARVRELKAIKQTIKSILEDFPETRNDDNLLYYYYCESKHKGFLNMSLGNALQTMKLLGVPPIESIGRARRKLQAEFPHLRAVGNVEAGRMLNEEVYRQFAKTT